MSILSTLALLAAGVAAKIRKPDHEIAKLKSENAIIAELQAQVHDLNREFDTTLARVSRQRDDWQTLALSYRREVMERRQPHFIDETMRLHIQQQTAQGLAQQMLAQQAQLQQAQLQQAAFQGAQNHNAFQGGIQNFHQAAQFGEWRDFCNCVPARHDMLLRP